MDDGSTDGSGDIIDRYAKDDEKSITFDRVLLVGGEGEPKIGMPAVESRNRGVEECWCSGICFIAYFNKGSRWSPTLEGLSAKLDIPEN